MLQKITHAWLRFRLKSESDTALPTPKLSEPTPSAEADDSMARNKFKPGDSFSLNLKKMTFQANGSGLRYLGWGVISLVLVRLALFAVGTVVTISAVPIGRAGISALMKFTSQ